METAFGFPIVNAGNVFDVLTDLGIKRWEKLEAPLPLDQYLKRDLVPELRQEVERFAPKIEAMRLRRPWDDGIYTGFRNVDKDWTTTLMLLPGDLVPIVGEYKHGVDEVILVPPAGVPNAGESMRDCAKREAEEESGIPLSRVIPLLDSDTQGLAVSGRRNTQRHHPFLGIPEVPIVPGPSKLDANERLKLVLVPLVEWMKLIRCGRGIEDCAVSVTYLSLALLGRHHLIGV